MHVLISGISWKITLDGRIYIQSVLCWSVEILSLGPPPLTFPFATYSWDSKLDTLTTVYLPSNQSTSSARAQGPIYNFGPLSLHNLSFKLKKYIYIFFRKNNYMSKIFPKIYLIFDLECFHSIIFKVLLLCCHQTNE